MSQTVISVLISAGGIILAAAIIGAVRGAFKVAGAIRDNTRAVEEIGKQMAEYIHENDTRSTVMQKDIQDLKDWRLRTEATNRAAALGTPGAAAAT